MKAKMWVKSERGALCRLCPHFCCLSAEKPLGRCNVRYYKNGEVFTLVDTHLAAVHVDPVEKKPLYHFMPGSKALSVGTVGCNLHCLWCQNHSLITAAQSDRVFFSDYENLKPLFGQAYNASDLVRFAVSEGIESFAYTYNEPTVFFEQMQNIAELAAENGKSNIMVSNGYFSKQAFEELKSFIHAFNIDIKAFSEKTYQTFCSASLKPVLDSCVRIKEAGLHLEITTLLIPDVNDSTEELTLLAAFIKENLGRETVWHLSAFHPDYEMRGNIPTPLAVLDKAFEIGKKAGIEYIYYGNVPKENNTLCPQCRSVLVRRNGYFVQVSDGFSGSCPHCGQKISGIWHSGQQAKP